jgi:hypothetical protein
MPTGYSFFPSFFIKNILQRELADLLQFAALALRRRAE